MADKDNKGKTKLEVFSDEDTRVDSLHRGQKAEAKYRVGKIHEEESVSIAAPPSQKKGLKTITKGAVGFRSAAPLPMPHSASQTVTEARALVRDKIQGSKDEHRQKVWDKLDAARKSASDRKDRLKSFQPARPATLEPIDDE